MFNRLYVPAIALVLGMSAAPSLADSFGPATIDAAFLANVKSVCTSTTMHRSQLAQVACDSGHYPAVVTAGNAFANRGTGAEFNALIRQLTASVAK